MAHDELCSQLESMIDRKGIIDVLAALEFVCMEKAEHIRQNWQDKATAKPWDSVAKKFYAIARWVQDNKYAM